MAGGEIVAAVDHEVVLCRERLEALSVHPLRERRDRDAGIDRRERVARRIHLLPPHRFHAVHDLALQVGEVDLLVVAEGDGAHSRRCEVERDRRAEPSRSDHQRARGEQFLLAFDADLRQQNVAAVAQQLFVVHSSV
jgi:hypothetical protein